MSGKARRNRGASTSAAASSKTAAARPTTARGISAPPPTSIRHGLCQRFLFEIRPGSQAFRYDVSVALCFGVQKERREPTEKRRELTGRIGGGAGKQSLNRALNRSIVYSVREKLRLTTAIVYDNAATLYTAAPLNLKPDFCLNLSPAEVSAFVRDNAGAQLKSVSVSISANAAVPQLSLDKIERVTEADAAKPDPNLPLRTFLELATSELAIDSGKFAAVGPGKLYSNVASDFTVAPEGVIVRPGVRKGVSIVDNHGNPTPCVDIEVKSSPFFKPQSVIDMAKSIHPHPSGADDFADILDMLEDVVVQPTHRKHATFAVGNFSADPIAAIPADVNDPSGDSVVDYFAKKYNYKIKYPSFPGVRPQPNPSKLSYPAELLQILPNQVLPLHKMSDGLQALLHTQNNVRPAVRYQKVLRMCQALELFTHDNSVLNAFGISIRLDSNHLDLKVFSPPKIVYNGAREAPVDALKASWRSGKYSHTPKLAAGHVWAIFYPAAEANVVNQFAAKLAQAAKDKGVFLGDKPPKMLANDTMELVGEFEKLPSDKLKFVLYIDSIVNKESHLRLKLAENLHKILTQHVTLETVRSVVLENKFITLENILAKANSKLGGVSYSPQLGQLAGEAAAMQLREGDTLVIGLDVAHPKAPSVAEKRQLRRQGLANANVSIHPSVVGICANFAQNPEHFSGGFFFQNTRSEQIDALELEQWAAVFLSELAKNRPNKQRPKNVIVLRDGLSEGQYQMAKEVELEAIKTAVAKFDANYKPNFTLAIATKRHLKRLYECGGGASGGGGGGASASGGGGSTENPPPFCVADDKFMRYGGGERTGQKFAVPHRAIKGTNKNVQLDIIVNESPLSRDEMTRFVFALSYSHQIISSATSLPQPVYQADLLAGRGNENYSALRRFKPELVKYEPLTIGKGRGERTINVVDTVALNALLSLRDTTMIATRFTS